MKHKNMISNIKKNNKDKPTKPKLADDEYLVIKKRARHEIKVKGSKFIATAVTVTSEEKAIDFINEIKKEFHDATHNCSAYRVMENKKILTRFNDDGEPSGTAGRPILHAIEGKDLTNACIVVTRYFGGTKLGPGGLVRAYGGATSELLENCETEKKYRTGEFSFTVAFDFVSVIHNIVENFKGTILETDYQDDVSFTVELRESKLNSFKEKLTEATNGQVKF